MTRPPSLEAHIVSQAKMLGFESIGFTKATLPESVYQRLRVFVEAGRHGSMSWMATRQDARAQPKHLWPEVKKRD